MKNLKNRKVLKIQRIFNSNWIGTKQLANLCLSNMRFIHTQHANRHFPRDIKTKKIRNRLMYHVDVNLVRFINARVAKVIAMDEASAKRRAEWALTKKK